ncbi:hypothetical protein [Chromobacterium violaceum]|uniref:hypothetical protein n=1 Tax=Chromobacterium violaceum TaxID=536 RepID=UPI00111C4A6D|nr:hypothetical protein [Chromobacterium violaceum]
MCIVIDPPVFISIFKKSDADHDDFVPILNFINQNDGEFAIGGSDYKRELIKLGTIIKAVLEYEKKGRLKKISDDEVDEKKIFLKRIETSPDFDDAHLIALVILSRSSVVCTKDKRAHRFIKCRKFYEKDNLCRPSIYTDSQHVDLLRKKKQKHSSGR